MRLSSRTPAVSRTLLSPALLLALATLLTAFLASGGRTAAEQGPLLDVTRWTVDDLVHAETASGWDVAADGSFAVWLRSTVEKVDGEEKRLSRLWWSSLDRPRDEAEDGPGDESGGGSRVEPGDRPGDAPGAASRPLTRGTDGVSSPRLSPDDRHVAFLSSRELPGGNDEDGGDDGPGDPAKSQLWALPLAGGEAFPVTRLERSPRGFGWIDAETLVVAAEENPSAWERERKRRKDTAQVVDDAERTPPVRLFRVSLDGEVRRLTRNDDWIEALAVSPDGRWAVVSAQQSLSYEFDQAVPPKTFLVDLESGERTALELTERIPGGSGEGMIERPLIPSDVRWALDGSGFYLTDAYTTHPRYRNATVTRLHFHDVASGRTTRVDLGWERGLGGDYAPTRDGVIALLADGVRYRPARYTRTGDGWRRQDLGGEHARNLDRWELSEDGITLVYQSSAASRPPQWYRARLQREGREESKSKGASRLAGTRRLTDLNAGWKHKPTGRVEVVRFTGARGDEVEGLLHYPLNWKEGERRPLILDIHGGPTGTDRDSWDQRWANPGILWRQQGAFILQVNYHGSAGYGLEWAESIERRYYELEIPDLEAGVDDAIARGLADPERLATSGWSNGGILSAELITRSERYKAASVGAADVEWISDWANVDFGAAFDNYYFGGPPWEIPQTYIDKSPFFRLSGVTTPTIVYTGTEDRNVPPHQSWSLFRALQQIGETPVRLVLFPGEPHGLRKVAHQRRKLEEDLAWFDDHLFGRSEVDPDLEGSLADSLRKGSPLAGLLARAGAARVGDVYGREVSGVLVPETVAFGAAEPGLEVGRFEVTRAQWATFEGVGDAGDRAAEESNLPTTGITFEQAQRYAAWLSETTGDTWRLPTKKEAETLARAARGPGDGNTLDRWAGYTPSPDDRSRLLELLESHTGTGGLGDGALLLPVGSLPGAGDPMIFDLDGNAAEWAIGKDGKRVAAGPSADRSTDDADASEPVPAYVGLRVMRQSPRPE